MVDKIHQAVDIVIPYISPNKRTTDDNEDDDDDKIILLSNDQIRRRPLYRIKDIKYFEYIQQQFKTHNRIILPTYDTHAYYSCEKNEMEQKVRDHITCTNAYRFIMELNQTNQYLFDGLLKQRDTQITTTLNHLFHYQCITYTQWQQMIIRQSKSRYDLLYFLPHPRIENVPFRPMILERHRLTMNITRFLTRLLQPIYNHVTSSQTFFSGMDALDAIREYTRKGLLQINTLFGMLTVHDLSTSISYENMYEKLQSFLIESKFNEQMQGITIPTILHLVRLCLEQRYIQFEDKVYQQIKGGPFNAPLIMLLTNIYMYYWEKNLVTILHEHNEIYGRHTDEILFTWNQSEQRLYDILHEMNRQHIHIKMSLYLNQTIDYLDIHLSHMDGQLKSKIVHHLDTEPYSLPFFHDTMKLSYVKLFRTALLRATRCYINVSDFANELEYIKSSFQYNGVHDRFCFDQIQLFFNQFDASDLKIHYGSQFYDQLQYSRLRHNVLKFCQRQKKAKSCIRRRRKTTKDQHQLHFTQSVLLTSNLISSSNR